MLSRVLLLVSAVAIGSQALKCIHQANDKQTLVMGNYNGPVTIPIDIGSYECEKGLDRCATFGPTPTLTFMSWEGGKVLSPLLIFGTTGTVEGTTCVSQADCAKMSASQSDTCKTKQNCCCAKDNCADYNNSSLSLSLLSSSAALLAYVVAKY